MASQPKLGFSCLFLHVPTRLTPAVVLIPCGPNVLERDPPRVPGLLWAPTYRERWIEGNRLRRLGRAERKIGALTLLLVRSLTTAQPGRSGPTLA